LTSWSILHAFILACSILGSVDGKKDAKAEEDEKPAIVGKEEASESGKKANLADNVRCMDRFWKELSCAVSGIHLVVL
jgi:hypothetical protein